MIRFHIPLVRSHCGWPCRSNNRRKTSYLQCKQLHNNGNRKRVKEEMPQKRCLQELPDKSKAVLLCQVLPPTFLANSYSIDRKYVWIVIRFCVEVQWVLRFITLAGCSPRRAKTSGVMLPISRHLCTKYTRDFPYLRKTTSHCRIGRKNGPTLLGRLCS